MSAALRRELVEICHHLYRRFYLVGGDGNVSVRLDERRFLVTPSGRNKGFVTPEELVMVDATGRPLGQGRPSSETAMHLEVYRQRPEIEAVVHAHPRAATAFACAGIALDSCLMTESVSLVGTVPLAPLALPSTDALAESIRSLVPRTQAILLRSHGVITYGRDLMAAYNLMEAVEQFAEVQHRVLQLGGGSVPAEAAVELKALRARYGWSDPIVPCDPASPLSKRR